MDGVITLTGTELVLGSIAVVVLAVAVWLAGRVLLAAAGIVGIEWLMIHYAADDLTILLTTLAIPALFAGYVLTEALAGGGRRHRRGRQR